jgi:LPXTG-motif cell wall-anchored protein
MPSGARVTALAATGLDSTTILVIVGMVLLLGGAGLELLGRTRAITVA